MESANTEEVRSVKLWLIGCLGLALLLPCAGIGVSLWSGFIAFRDSLDKAISEGFRELGEQTQVVFGFEGNLRVGNLDVAYELTTEEFRSRQSRVEFDGFIAKHPELRHPCVELTPQERTEEELREESCVYKITTETADSVRSTFKVRLQKEKGKWKVDELILP
jgi:hypothetical protein